MQDLLTTKEFGPQSLSPCLFLRSSGETKESEIPTNFAGAQEPKKTKQDKTTRFSSY